MENSVQKSMNLALAKAAEQEEEQKINIASGEDVGFLYEEGEKEDVEA